MTTEPKNQTAKPKTPKSTRYKPTSKESLRRLSIQQAAQYRLFLTEELSKLEEVLKELVPLPSSQEVRRLNPSLSIFDSTLPTPNFNGSSNAKVNPNVEPPLNVEFSLAKPMDPDTTEDILLKDIQNLYDPSNSGAGPQLHSDSLGFEYFKEGAEESDFDSPGH
jgi:hypothetical protein